MSTLNGKPLNLTAGLLLAEDIEAIDDITAGDDIFVGDQIVLTGGGVITTTANGLVQIVPHGTGITQIGDAGSPSYLSSPTNDDLYVAGRAEIANFLYCSWLATNSGIGIGGGTSPTSMLTRNTSQTVNTTALEACVTSRSILIYERGDAATDFGHTQQTNPTLFLHSSDATDVTQWLSLAHDQTDSVIGSGKGAVTLAQGVLRMAETTTPTARTNYGDVYTKTDNNMYFQDGAGSEHVVRLGSSDYGEFGNTVAADEVLVSADEWHAAYNANINASAPHLSVGFTFVAGSNGTGNVTTAAAGAAININDAAHGLLSGDYVTVQSANHVGIGTVTLVDVDNFTVDIAYVGDEVATWQMGSYLKVATTGIYRGVWNASFSQSLNNTQTSIIAPVVNATVATKAFASRLLANNSDVGSIGGNGIMSFTANDRVWFAIQTTAAQTITVENRNVSIH